MAEMSCELCNRRPLDVYYGGRAICDVCVEGTIHDLGYECAANFHEMAQYCETTATDEEVASAVAERLRDRQHALASRLQGEFAL